MIREPGARISIRAMGALSRPLIKAEYMTATVLLHSSSTPCTRAGSIYELFSLPAPTLAC